MPILSSLRIKEMEVIYVRMKSKSMRVAAVISSVLLMTVLLSSTALADTNGTELKVTDQPDKLVLELGSDWAGVEFELTTDAGIFPVPVVVNELGVLSMELGGSKTYTLSRISAVPEPEPVDTVLPEPTAQPVANTATPDSENDRGGVPIMQLVIFIGGMLAAGGGLAYMYFSKRRTAQYDYDDDDYGEDEQ